MYIHVCRRDFYSIKPFERIQLLFAQTSVVRVVPTDARVSFILYYTVSVVPACTLARVGGTFRGERRGQGGRVRMSVLLLLLFCDVTYEQKRRAGTRAWEHQKYEKKIKIKIKIRSYIKSDERRVVRRKSEIARPTAVASPPAFCNQSKTTAIFRTRRGLGNVVQCFDAVLNYCCAVYITFSG